MLPPKITIKIILFKCSHGTTYIMNLKQKIYCKTKYFITKIIKIVLCNKVEWVVGAATPHHSDGYIKNKFKPTRI